MEKNVSTDQVPQKRRTSIKRMVIIFSAVLFSIIFFGGSTAFVLSMWQMIHTSTGSQLENAVETETVRLEASVNGEIALALKMADSPVIKRHFQNPGNSELREIAFEEIEGYRRAFSGDTIFWASDVDKEFYFSEDNHYTLDTNDPDEYWYNQTLYQTPSFNFNINYNAELKKILLFINAPVFDSAHRPIGLVGTGIDVSEFVNDIYRNYTGTADLYFFNSLGEITGARDMNLITSKTTIDKHLGNTGVEILAKVKELKEIEGEAFSFNASSGEVVAIGIVGALQWHIVTVHPITIGDALNSAMTVLFVLMMAVIAIILVIFLVFIIGLLNPLNQIVKALDRISTDWDLTLRLELNRRDEIGTLGEFFNLTFERMRNLIFSIRKETEVLSEIGNDLASNMNETAAAVNEIAANIQSIKGRVINQSASVTETHATMEQLVGNIKKLDDHVENQSNNISQSSSAIEQMVANIRSVTDTLVKNGDNVKTLTDSSIPRKWAIPGCRKWRRTFRKSPASPKG
jgi:methyl-accepting chemotaxis protein